MISYVLTDAAEADLRELIRYSRAQWGVTQTQAYVKKLKKGMTEVAAGKENYKEMNDLLPNL